MDLELWCPCCRGELRGDAERLGCGHCGRDFPVTLGIPDLRVFPDPYIDLESDRAKGRQLAARFDELTFAELVAYYYRVTPAVPAADAGRYTRGVLAGPARAEATLATWEAATGPLASRAARLLEIGCGTAPLLVVAAARYGGLVGVDIAFRWLVVGKKRLAEAGLDVPLVCACAEALPFPDASFDRVVGDSVLEVVADQPRVLAEARRALRPGGYLLLSTPNRWSLGPDPHAGVWAGSLLPASWLAAYVRRRGGIPPRRRLLAAGGLSRLIRQAGFGPPRLLLPHVPAGQRRHFGALARRLVDLYHLARRVGAGRRVLRVVGPVLLAVTRKPASLPAADPGRSRPP